MPHMLHWIETRGFVREYILTFLVAPRTSSTPRHAMKGDIHSCNDLHFFWFGRRVASVSSCLFARCVAKKQIRCLYRCFEYASIHTSGSVYMYIIYRYLAGCWMPAAEEEKDRRVDAARNPKTLFFPALCGADLYGRDYNTSLAAATAHTECI